MLHYNNHQAALDQKFIDRNVFRQIESNVYKTGKKKSRKKEQSKTNNDAAVWISACECRCKEIATKTKPIKSCSGKQKLTDRLGGYILEIERRKTLLMLMSEHCFNNTTMHFIICVCVAIHYTHLLYVDGIPSASCPSELGCHSFAMPNMNL